MSDLLNSTINESLKNTDLNQVTEIVSYIPRVMTEKTIEILASLNFTATPRFVSVLFAFISIGLVYLGIKITQPLIKWILVILGLVTLAGIFIPGW